MLEWAVIGAAVLPHLKEFAKDQGKKLAKESADSGLHEVYKHLVPDATLVAANEAFFGRFRIELESSDLKTFTAEQTKDDLKEFLSNPAVQAVIQTPLDGHSTTDSRLLSSIWSEMGLTTLSSDFRWETVAARYRDVLIERGLSRGDLRPVFAKLAEIADGIRQGQGLIPGFDTSAYLRRVQQDYGNLKLYQLHTASADDVVKLRDIFVPQAVRESLPPSDIPDGHRKRLRGDDGDLEPPDLDPKRRDLRRIEDDSDELKSRYLSLPLRPILEVTSDPNALRAVILGGPGSGKSSLLQYLTLESAGSY